MSAATAHHTGAGGSALDAECRRVSVQLGEMRAEVGCYTTWYNEHRPHRDLGGSTRTDTYTGSARETLRMKPRPEWPVEDESKRAKRIRLEPSFVDGRRHQPVVELQRVAWTAAELIEMRRSR